jgi:hypothetical protein
MRLFDIVTLSDKNISTRLADPVGIIVGGTTVISQLFPNLLGTERASEQDFRTLFPSNGYWTSQFRTYLQNRIKYKKDIGRDLQTYTLQFVIDNNSAICPGTYTFQNPPGNNPGGGGASGWLPCVESFYRILQQESRTGGASPVGTIAPGLSGINWTEIVPYALGGIALFVLLQGRKKKR